MNSFYLMLALSSVAMLLGLLVGPFTATAAGFATCYFLSLAWNPDMQDDKPLRLLRRWCPCESCRS